jgi:transposase
MSAQLALRFDEVPVTCTAQERYHEIAPILAGKCSPAERAESLNVGYSTVTRWLREFREKGLPGLFPPTQYPREPYTPERIIVVLVHLKCCAPKSSDFELSRVATHLTGYRLHNETVKALLARYFFWRYEEFRIVWPVPSEPGAMRQEIVKLRQAGWSDRSIAYLLRCSGKTVTKWWRRFQQSQQQTSQQMQMPLWYDALPRAPQNPGRKVFFGAIHAVLELQKKYGYAGAFRIKGYLEADYHIYLGETTIRKIMALNRRLHLAPRRPIKVEEPREIRQGPKKSRHPFEYVFVDFRYLDAKPGGVQLYSTLLLEGLSRTILAGSLTTDQSAGVLLHVYFQALLRWGLWEEVISDHGGQFRDHDWIRANQRLGIRYEMYEKGQPWRNLIESQFGIQARLGEYYWERCKTVDEAVEFHRELIRDHNRLPHWAHHRRSDGKHSPLAVLGQAKGKQADPADIQRAFGQRYCQRLTDARGFVKIGRWKVYVEEGLPRTPVQLSYWDGKLRAEYQSQILMEYQCKWGEKSPRPTVLSQPLHHAHPFQSRQNVLFDPLWIRYPVDLSTKSFQRSEKKPIESKQLRLYLGPEIVKSA